MGRVTRPCIAYFATVNGAAKLIIMPPETYHQVPSKGIATAMFLYRKGSLTKMFCLFVVFFRNFLYQACQKSCFLKMHNREKCSVFYTLR